MEDNHTDKVSEPLGSYNVNQGFNSVQLHILEMFNYCKSEKTMNELKNVLAGFYAKQVQEEADRMWEEGTLDDDAIEQILGEHWRTPYDQD